MTMTFVKEVKRNWKSVAEARSLIRFQRARLYLHLKQLNENKPDIGKVEYPENASEEEMKIMDLKIASNKKQIVHFINGANSLRAFRKEIDEFEKIVNATERSIEDSESLYDMFFGRK